MSYTVLSACMSKWLDRKLYAVPRAYAGFQQVLQFGAARLLDVNNTRQHHAEGRNALMLTAWARCFRMPEPGTSANRTQWRKPHAAPFAYCIACHRPFNKRCTYVLDNSCL